MPGQDVAYYAFGDRIFTGNADGLTTIVESFFEAGPPATIVFDLERVRLCDSYGLRFFLNLQRRASANKKTMILYRPDSIFRNLLEDTRLIHVFTVTDKLDPAIESAINS